MRRSGRGRRRLAVAVLGVAGGLYWAALTPVGASAEVTNEGLACKATINTFDVGALDSEDDSKAVHVAREGAVSVSMTANKVIADWYVDVAFSFRGWRADEGHGGLHSEWSTTVGVDKYARFGVGLYRVEAHSTGTDGTSCTAAALVFVDAEPIPGTVAGDVGAAIVVVTSAGLAGSAIAAGRGGEVHRGDLTGDAGIPTGILPATDDWCFPGFVVPMLLTMALMVVGAGGGAPAVPPAEPGALAPTLRRARWRPHVAGIPIASGIFGALGALTLLQQYGKLFPTLRVVITALVAGVVVGIALPSATRVLAVRRYNRRLAALEAAQRTQP